MFQTNFIISNEVNFDGYDFILFCFMNISLEVITIACFAWIGHYRLHKPETPLHVKCC
jgi:hypothetical protein